MTEAELEQLEAQFSDYLDGGMTSEQKQAFDARLAESDDARAAFEEFKQTIEAVSGLHKMAAPQAFETEVVQTIHRRSAGRFFGRKAFGDRVPFELIAVIALAAMLGLYFLMRSSDTGSAKLDPERDGVQEISPETKEAIPKP